MEIIKTEIKEVFELRPRVFEDSRGYFLETFNASKFNELSGLSIDFVQDNESFSSKGVLRGLHYQLPPFAQAKLVRVVKGKVLDVALDIRKSSPTFGQSVVVELNDKDKNMLFIPRGFAHGFVVLSEEAIFSYKVDNRYSKEHERGIIYNDKNLAIDWGIDVTNIVLSDKDLILPELCDTEVFE